MPRKLGIVFLRAQISNFSGGTCLQIPMAKVAFQPPIYPELPTFILADIYFKCYWKQCGTAMIFTLGKWNEDVKTGKQKNLHFTSQCCTSQHFTSPCFTSTVQSTKYSIPSTCQTWLSNNQITFCLSVKWQLAFWKITPMFLREQEFPIKLQTLAWKVK